MASTEIPPGDDVPVYTVDLSLPPRERYKELALQYVEELQSLPLLFDGLLKENGLGGRKTSACMRWLARMLLTKLYNAEENEELRGIQEAIGMPDFYLLVAFNVLLDLLMGCSSGAVKASHLGNDKPSSKMLHFRTLDWEMHPLRKLVVQLNYQSKPGGPIIGQSITYVGYVGILTGVRKGLSLSLNFRRIHTTGFWASPRYAFSQLLVLIGQQRSISSILRGLIHPVCDTNGVYGAASVTLDHIVAMLPSISTPAAYLTFCDGTETVVMEKDNQTAVVIRSSTFNNVTNHDSQMETAEGCLKAPGEAYPTIKAQDLDIYRESIFRKVCMKDKYNSAVAVGSVINEATVVTWLCSQPICDESTHFAAVMDPTAGTVTWVKRWLEPIPVDPTNTLRQARIDALMKKKGFKDRTIPTKKED